MTFQKGDWVLWRGLIERVRFAHERYIQMESGKIIMRADLASHQIPWHKPPGAFSWKPL